MRNNYIPPVIGEIHMNTHDVVCGSPESDGYVIDSSNPFSGDTELIW